MESDVAKLNSTLAALDAEHNKYVRGEKLKIGVLCALVLFVCGYMTWIFVSIGKLDAQSMTRIAVSQCIDKNIPQAKAQAKSAVIAAAPDVIATLEKNLLEMPPQLRERAEAQVMMQIRAMMAQLETRFQIELVKAFDAQVKMIEQNVKADATTEQKVDIVMTALRSEYKKTIRDLLDAMYPEYAKNVHQVTAYVMHLQQNDNLTEEERLHRELIETTLVLTPKLSLVDFGTFKKPAQ